MLETSVLLDNPSGGGGGGAAAAVAEAAEPKNEGGGGGGGGGEDEGGNQNSGGNRWPHEETLALLKIRSEMDLAFRDSTLKGPLWDGVSRKMEEFGYQRSAKKCREKFENIYKYHRRTKEGRSGRQNGKNYRFFEQLELFDAMQANKITMMDMNDTAELASPVAMIKPNTNIVQDFRMRPHGGGADVLSASTSTTYSSGKESGASVTRKRKRKLAEYFEKMMKEVLEKQEDLQNKFLEAIDRSEKERMIREEAWKRQEMERLKREQESLAQERAISEAKDAAVIAFLQKIAKQPILVQLPMNNPAPVSQKHVDKVFDKDTNIQEDVVQKINDKKENGSGETSSSRWPKAEVEALIKIRTNLDLQHHDSGSKGPLWEDISAEMKKIGYDRNAKRCKEKWENINKYYRRVKESNKRRPEDSKTCPYFHILDSLYQTKSRKVVELSSTPDLSNFNVKAGEMLLQIMSQNQQQQSGKEDGERTNTHQSQEHDEDDVDDEGESEDGFQIVANQP